jgi:hypothetical protein
MLIRISRCPRTPALAIGAVERLKRAWARVMAPQVSPQHSSGATAPSTPAAGILDEVAREIADRIITPCLFEQPSPKANALIGRGSLVAVPSTSCWRLTSRQVPSKCLV